MTTRHLSFDPKSRGAERVEENGICLRPIGRFQYVVRLTDSENRHVVTLAVDPFGGFQGECTCDGWKFHESACAHLWAARHAAENDLIKLYEPDEALNGEPRCPTCGNVAPGAYDV